jgi:hypothetical protein
MSPEEIPQPKTRGLTPEAAKALGMEDDTSSESEYSNVPDDISSLDDFGPIAETDPEFGYPSMTPLFTEGDVIDAQLNSDLETAKPADRSRKSRERSSDDVPREPKSGPPSIDEWSRFFSRVVLRTFCDVYINYATRGIDEDVFNDRDLERLSMTDDERKLIATPFAEISNKSKFMRKHGRMIVASGDSFNALIVLGAWMSRVNRIAAKYRPRNVRVKNVSNRPDSPPGNAAQNGNGFYGTSGGRIADGFPIIPGNS